MSRKPHASHPVMFCGGFSFTKGVEIRKAVMGKEEESPILLEERVFSGFWDVFLNRVLEKIKFSRK